MIERFGEEEQNNVHEAIKIGKLSEFFKNPRGGEWVQRLEEMFAKYHGMPYAISCSNGTSALHIALEAVCARVKVKPSPVVVTPYSFIASVTSVLMAGLKPHFIDVDAKTGTIPDLYDRGQAIPRSAKIIIPVNLLGYPADYDRINANSTWGHIIEDNAQGLGAFYHGKIAGSLGDISTCSLQYTKTITTGGEGGMILTRDPELNRLCMEIRNHGSQYCDSPFVTYNYRLTEIQAAFGVAQMEKLHKFVDIQVGNAEYILNHLPRGIKAPYKENGVDPAYFLVGCSFDEKEAGMSRETFIQKCVETGISKGVPGASIGAGYTTPIYNKPLFKEFRPNTPLPNVENIIKKAIWFDVHRWRPLDDVKADLETMNKILD